MKKLLTALILLIGANAKCQTLSYILPDAAAPGMAVYTELIGPNISGNFGSDGLNQVSIEFINPADALRVIIGPRVTSWGGRMVSLFVIIPTGVTLGPVPFRLVSASGKSNVDTFFVVQPQHLGDNLAPGALGSGGDYGSVSRRNTLVVDSLILGQGLFTVCNQDPDPNTPGNQSFLPLTILSQGAVRIEGTLSLDGDSMNAVAGGGGGGARETTIGGNGYSGGGGMHGVGGISSGGVATGWNGADALNGAPGGGGLGDRWFDDQGGGGGTAFPFGTASQAGTWWAEGGNNPPGGVGGGSGGGERWIGSPDSSFGGGGGAFATNGANSGTAGPNGGVAYGNCLIVPFCGGSGGGGGNQYGSGYAGSGGAGGGAVHIMSMNSIEVSGAISANGADGESTHGVYRGGGGGGGAGGAIALTAPVVELDGQLSVQGGNGGVAVHQDIEGGVDGGNGGLGRIRIIGLLERSAQQLAAVRMPSVTHIGASGESSNISGIGSPNDSVIIYTERAGIWNYDNPHSVLVDGNGQWEINGAQFLMQSDHIAILGKLDLPDQGPFVEEPLLVLSPAIAIPQQASESVSDIQVSLPLAIQVEVTDPTQLRLQFGGPSLELLDAKVFDMLGREVIGTQIQLDGHGRNEWILPTKNLGNGSYIVTSSFGSGTASRTFFIAR